MEVFIHEGHGDARMKNQSIVPLFFIRESPCSPWTEIIRLSRQPSAAVRPCAFRRGMAGRGFPGAMPLGVPSNLTYSRT